MIDVALDNTCPDKVRASLNRHRKTDIDLALMLSPGADIVLEEMAQEAKRIKNERFGKIIQLYAPLYLSNRCLGDCPYCGFNNKAKITRRTLSLDEAKLECAAIAKEGIRHVLLVSGSFTGTMNIGYLAEVTRALKDIVPSISVEVPSLKQADYEKLRNSGVDGVTLYQETYDRHRYANLHRNGEKADFDFRLKAMDRAGAAGIRKLTVGTLWGLSPWRMDALRLGLHANSLQKKWWRSQVLIGLPRLNNVPDSFSIPHPVNNRSLVQIITALRIYLEDAGLVLSTRETAKLRDNLILLGITQISAGSSTEPGGYLTPGASGEQFAVTDTRSPNRMVDVLKDCGYDPVFKDWDTCLDEQGWRSE